MQGEGHVAAHHLAVVMSELGETFEEVDYEETMEKAEIALREAGFALIFVKRQTADGWAAPLIQIYGKSAEGPGPRTVRQTVRMTEKEVLDLS